MKNKAKILLMLIGASILLFNILIKKSAISNQTTHTLAIEEAKAASHPEAYNKWCKYFPQTEGCCDHSTRTCTNQNFCDSDDCD